MIAQMIRKKILAAHRRNVVRQSFDHKERISQELYKLIEAARNEFVEDSRAALDSFLRECFEDALKMEIQK